MKSFSTRLLATLLVLVMLIGMLPATALAAGEKMTISASTVSALAGSTVTVKIELKDNPGISSVQLEVSFDDSMLDLTAIEYNTAMGGQSLPPQKLVSPAKLTWVSPFANFNGDATFATLTFKIADDAAEDSVYPVTISYDPNNIYNMDENNIPCNVIDGSVKVLSCVPGDINGDRVVNNKDVTRMFQYIAGWEVEVNEPALDTNGDGYVNNKDLTRLFQFVAGWDVELHCGSATTTKCNHELIAFEAEPATCTENGHIAYWQCSLCNKYFASADAVAETTVDKLVIEATGHTVVIDPAVEPTYDSVGYTEGSHCSVCKAVIVAQTEIPKLSKTEYAITYNIANNDMYLAGVEIENPNPATYTAEDGLTLKNLKVPGYTFEGWYDAPGANGEIVKSIPAGSKGDVELYAKWSIVEYTVMFESDLIPVEEIKYTVDRDTVLPTPTLDGYIFAGWSNDDGEIIKKISKGTVGHQTYMANWLSERNQAWTKTKLDAPIIYEDDDVILFTYEIGEIRNVPLYVIHDFGKINSNGVEKTVTKTYSTTVSESQMETYTETVSKATTDSYGWALSNGWTESVSVNEEWAKENGITTSEAQTICTTETGNWFVSSGSSGSSTTQQLDITDSHRLETTTNNKKSYNNTETGASTNMEANLDVGLEAKIAPGVKGTLETGVNVGANNSAKVQSGWSSDDTTNNESGSSQHHETNVSNTGSWNASSGYGGSISTSNSITVSQEISEKISQKYGYGEQYINTGDQSQTQGFVASESSSDQYGSSVVFSTVTTEEVTATYTTSNTMSGYHRWIMAGTAHVFAVVGYDIGTKSYFVYNYSVMDDEIHEFEDYSYAYSSYNDNENGVIKFEAPTDIMNYVADRVCESEGLEVSKDGVITGYTGTDTFVVIPEYKVIKNLDGTPSVIKVTGISADAFAGNDYIQVVGISDFITDIPAGAFENCTALEEVYGANIESIGDRAFAGCVSLKNCVIGEHVTTMGDEVFEGLENISAKAANMSIVKATLASGAKNITIEIADSCNDLKNTTLKVYNTTESFTFNGFGKEFTNVYIESDAAKTSIHRANFVSSSKAPIRLSSADVVLQEINVTAPTLGLILLAEKTNIALYGESHITTSNVNAMLSKNISFSKLNNDLYSHFYVSGNLLICGGVGNGRYMTVSNGSIVTIDEETFNKYANGIVNVSFDANGGNVASTEITAAYGDIYGTLPVPQRDNYTFAGWFTEATGGEQILPESVVTSFENHTLYAHWAANVFTLTFDANGGSVTTKDKVVTFGNAYGTLPTPTRTGFTFAGWYNASGAKVTADTVQSTAANTTLTAHWTANAYNVTFTNGTGYTIKVSRTSSPYAQAATGTLSSGSTIYYGDVLSVSYTPAANYEIATHGSNSVTVSGNVTSSIIYATAKLKANHVRTLSGTIGSEYGKSIRYYLEVYTVGHQLLIKGWMYDTANPAASLDIDIGSVFRETTNLKSASCGCGCGKNGYNRYHGFEFYQGNYSGNQRIMMHTWAADGQGPIRLWDSFNDSGYPQCWVPFAN